MADFDGDGQPDLLTADATGLLRFFSNYRAQNGIFSERTDLLYNALTGQYETTRPGPGRLRRTTAWPAADLNGDGAPELFVGTAGRRHPQLRHPQPHSSRPRRAEAARALALSIYPNPATATATVETAAPTRLTVLDLTGRVVRTTPRCAAPPRAEPDRPGARRVPGARRGPPMAPPPCSAWLVQ